MRSKTTFVVTIAATRRSHRFPVRLRDFGDQDFTSLTVCNALTSQDHADTTHANLLADSPPSEQRRARRLECESNISAVAVRPDFAECHGLRTGLQNRQVAGEAILRPLDVHQAARVRPTPSSALQ